jgi:glucose-1-phosphate adenylyltransferase
LNRKNGGISVYPPYVFNTTRDVFNSEVEALYTVRGFMMEAGEEYVVIANTNIAFNIDFDEVEDFHIGKGADITVLTYKVESPSTKKIVVSVDKNKRIKDMRLAVDGDKNALCDLNIYFVKKDLLISLVDKAYAYGYQDFERDILMKNLDDLYIMSYEVKDYVAVIDNIQSYFKHSMDLLDPKVRENLFYKNSTILTKVKDSIPARYGNDAVVSNSIIADGCVIEGTVENSILFRSVKVAKGAVVRNSIVMEDGIIMENATLDYTITDKDVIIKDGRHLSGHESYPMVVVKGKVI